RYRVPALNTGTMAGTDLSSRHSRRGARDGRRGRGCGIVRTPSVKVDETFGDALDTVDGVSRDVRRGASLRGVLSSVILRAAGLVALLRLRWHRPRPAPFSPILCSLSPRTRLFPRRRRPQSLASTCASW